MSIVLLDHLFILLLFIVQPIHGWLNYQRFIKRVNEGEAAHRRKLYVATIIGEWTALTVLLVAWWQLDRPLAWLGMNATLGNGFWACLVLGGGVLAYLARAGRGIAGMSQEERLSLRASLGDLRHFLPQSDAELKVFTGLSITAGIVEEIIFRGFALWYLASFMPITAAIILSSIAFGFGHSYQGANGILKTGIIGVVFGIIFVVSGSIWLPIILHMGLDLIQGRQIRELFRDVPAQATT